MIEAISKLTRFSLSRLLGIMRKEFLILSRDPTVIGMTVVVPIMQVLIFGYAINTNPKNLPAYIINQDNHQLSSQLIMGLKKTDYFNFVNADYSQKQADDLLAQGSLQFVLTIPANFSRDMIAGKRPAILLQADATDNVATAGASAAASAIASIVVNKQAQGVLAYLKREPPPFNLVIHRQYNPETVTRYSIVPGLIGVVIAMTLAMITSIAIVKEREIGTMEMLLAMPIAPLEVMIGKITPYILIGYGQVSVILIMAYFVMGIPFQGSVALLFLCCFPFILANLGVGLLFSTLANTQLQAVVAVFPYFLPSLLLSGFMFPFRGMPAWAEMLGSLLPMTYFLRISRGIILKGNDFLQVWPNLWPIILFSILIISISVLKYRNTLD